MTPEDVRAYRERLNWTQLDLARALGYQSGDAQRIVRAMETGRRQGKEFVVTAPTARMLAYIETIIAVARRPDISREARIQLLGALPESVRTKF